MIENAGLFFFKEISYLGKAFIGKGIIFRNRKGHFFIDRMLLVLKWVLVEEKWSWPLFFKNQGTFFFKKGSFFLKGKGPFIFLFKNGSYGAGG